MKPELNGTDLSGIRDPDGVPIFVRMVDVIKAHGSGYVEYQWPHPSSVEAAAKVSYVEQFEPWGRVIGTGVFVDQLQAAF
jgi:methyl-accepting chemotaxis protein